MIRILAFALKSNPDNFRGTYLDESSPFLSVKVQTKEIERVFRYGWTLCDWSAFFLHEAQQLVQKRPTIRMIIHFIKACQAVRAP